MRAFLETTVLVAAFQKLHPQHHPSVTLLAGQKKSAAFTAAHCLAEFYATTTRMPGKYRTSPQESLLFLSDIRARLTLITLEADEYGQLLDEAVQTEIAGGAIYDALIARCALKAKAQIIYTWNTRHFQRLGPDIAIRVREPGTA